jgi:SNF2 family DNA or RNA helicase
VVKVELSAEERHEYQKLEASAHSFYIEFQSNRVNNQSNILELKAKLLPMRIACSGGCYCEEYGVMNENWHLADVLFKSKFKSLSGELQRIEEEDAASKTLIFSHYNSTLRRLQEEFKKQGVSAVALTVEQTAKARARSLHDFQYDPQTTIFLLNRSSVVGVGVNLMRANRVVFMEPLLNPVLEAQVLGRVHRLGQKRSVEVIRFITNDSIESRLAEIEKNALTSSEGPVTSSHGANSSNSTQLSNQDFDILFVGIKSNEEKVKVCVAPWETEFYRAPGCTLFLPWNAS